MKKYLVREWRTAKGLSRQALLERTASQGFDSESTLKKIENGQTSSPQARTLQAIADALGITVGELTERPPKPRAVPRHRRPGVAPDQRMRLPWLQTETEPPLDEPGISAEERERRQAEHSRLDQQWRLVLDMPERVDPVPYIHVQGKRVRIRERQTTLGVMDSGVAGRALEGLIFVGVVSAVGRAMESAWDDPASYDAARARLHHMFEEALRVGELVWLADEYAGAGIGVRMWREVTADQMRAYRRAMETWEMTYSPHVQGWAERGPRWDEQGSRNVFAEVARLFEAFDEVFGASEAAVVAQENSDDE